MLFKRSSTKRNPIKTPALPDPGQSLGVEYRRKYLDILFWLVAVVLFGTLCAQQWAQYLFRSPPAPYISTSFAVVISILAVFRIWSISRELPSLELGIRGERHVGQLLDGLRSQGYRVFHDIVENGYNIDHVLIGPEGVFAIENKDHEQASGPGQTGDLRRANSRCWWIHPRSRPNRSGEGGRAASAIDLERAERSHYFSYSRRALS